MQLIDIIGYIAAALTTAAFIPQALRTIKTKHTQDLSLNMYISLNIGIVLWLTYGILQNVTPIIIANVVTLCFTSVILVMIIKYRKK